MHAEGGVSSQPFCQSKAASSLPRYSHMGRLVPNGALLQPLPFSALVPVLLLQAKLAARAAAREQASTGLRAHLKAIRTATAASSSGISDDGSAAAARPIGPEWVAGETPSSEAGDGGGGGDEATHEAGASGGSEDDGGLVGGLGGSSAGANSGSADVSGSDAHSGSGSIGLRRAGHSKDGGFVQILISPPPAGKAASPSQAAGSASTNGGFGSPAELPVPNSRTDPHNPNDTPHELTLAQPDLQQDGTPQPHAGTPMINSSGDSRQEASDWTPWPAGGPQRASASPGTPVLFGGGGGGCSAGFAQQQQLQHGYSPVDASAVAPPPHFAAASTAAEAASLTAGSGPAASDNSRDAHGAEQRHGARSRDAESALQVSRGMCKAPNLIFSILLFTSCVLDLTARLDAITDSQLLRTSVQENPQCESVKSAIS